MRLFLVAFSNWLHCLLLAAATIAVAGDGAHEHCVQNQQPQRYSRLEATYQTPAVTLTDQHGNAVALNDMLDGDAPVLLQFIFTTCPTVCPVLSSAFAAVQDQLDDQKTYRMVSITIDPEYDNPARLKDYATRMKAGANWVFLTGHAVDIVAIQKAYGVYRGNKMRHEPVTFLRSGAQSRWVRLDGFLAAGELLAEYRQLAAL